MRLTIGKKLTLGFSCVIALLVASAGLAWYQLLDLERSLHVAVDQSYPSRLACLTLAGELNDTSRTLRGYMLLGDDPKEAEHLKSERAAAWRTIDATLARLHELSAAWNSTDQRKKLAEVESLLQQLRPVQQKIEDSAQSGENNRPLHLFRTTAEPLIARITDALRTLESAPPLRDASADHAETRALLDDADRAFLLAMGDLREYLHGGDPATRRQVEEHWRVFDEAQQRLLGMVQRLPDAVHADGSALAAALREFAPLPPQLIALRSAPTWNTALSLNESEGIPLTRRARALLEELGDAMNEHVATHRQLILANLRTVTNSLLGGAVAAIAVAVVVSTLLSRRIVTALQTVVAAAQRIAAGDLTGNDLVIASRDEAGDLGASFNAMRASLKDMTGQIRQATENVNSTAAEILAATQQQAAATKEQAATIQQITSTLEEINQSGGQISERAKRVATTVEAAASATQRGMKATQDTSQTMEAVRNQVEEVAENVVSLSERTQTIGEIIATVSEIAEQSNLLALNASIEAVSAGERGGRFTVVAHEMKNLADRAKDCTVQVRTILSEIQKGINTSVMLTEEAVKRADGGKAQAHATENTIREVTGTNDESVQAFQQIVAGANQQQIGVGQVTQGMQDIRQAIKQTAASTVQLEKAAANMNALSQQLHRLVEQYRV